MSSQILSPVTARELVHLLILRELAGVSRGSSVTVKGGVNLRLFFGSVRYSEDMDLDGTAQASAAIRNNLKGMFGNREFTRNLQIFGIRGLDPGEGPNKDTETTFRYKFGVTVGGGIRYPTKVEVSFRKRHVADRAVLETPEPGILGTYGLDVFELRHYVREAAVRQKLDALGGRREAQARDVFDLHVLVPDPPPDRLVEFLAEALGRSRLEEAHGRALAITYREYEGQVFEFLGEEARSRYGGEGAWDEMRLRAAALIENVSKLQERR
ncbi:MAG: nucleotidyl transferase AbiEii/AbiGii toxin family protein [Gemmatimonadetes bacterium]|nr:nucleotidyl transferase AbiEii/AbiGii toxin family protein [Gemmatimonadota bacterium]